MLSDSELLNRMAKFRKISGPPAGIGNASSIESTRSGVPSIQPVGNFGFGGNSLGSPSGAPAAAHAFRSSRSFGVTRRSPTKWPNSGSALQGGISPDSTTSLIHSARFDASEYVSNGNGATAPSRWQSAQREKSIGAISRQYVGVANGSAAPATAPRTNKRQRVLVHVAIVTSPCTDTKQLDCPVTLLSEANPHETDATATCGATSRPHVEF